MLDSYRAKVDSILTPIAQALGFLSPNTISIISLISAGLTGIFFYLNYLYLSLLFLIISALFDAVDGKLARIQGKSSKRGDFIDHSFDRFSDVFILLGFTFSRYANVDLGIFALIGVILTSYMGTQAQALGLNRLYAGIMGRADRLVLMVIFIALQIPIGIIVRFPFLTLTPTNLMLLIFGILGSATVVQRFYIIFKELR
ncbi:phosphatidyltransferase [Thermoplasma volcanium GSS1]|uniref:Phosphatidyltransferase n=1 Tax=Thermoplasma volcanium (strain ATCC 51530 / DSM 4299 / JCM 9571 / NBRC 15438 / GSS1) TaxID=273116 RepID=Q97B39_THEVO|nr:CDP-alcohol phosphatidyltransferase family protein [Thermoplasma volcanium]BAB59762.1 phosphatidyltransferase [Thermoplasma volcanium GSS1]